MKVVVRVDASVQIGWGHVRRCLSLAAALEELGASTLFVWRDAGLDVHALVAAKGFADYRLPEAPSSAEVAAGVRHARWLRGSEADDAMDTARVAREWSGDLVLVDHYAIAADWHAAVRAATGAGIVVLDDLADRPLLPDLLVDQNPSADHAQKYAEVLSAGETCILGGPAYALLEPVYATHQKHVFQDQVRSIGIFMGGTDAGCFTEFGLDAIRQHSGFGGPIEVASTSTHPGLERLRDLARHDPALTLTLDSPNLADFFSRHDIQIGAGGGALWERCCIGVPTVALVCADNQLLSVPQLQDLGVVVGLDARDRSEDMAACLGRLVRSLILDTPARCALARRSLQLVDGCGAVRVAARMAALAGEIP